MYQCLNCKTKFDKPVIMPQREWHGEVGCCESTFWEACPICFRVEFDECDDGTDEEEG